MLARTLAALLLLLAACPKGSQTKVEPPPGGGGSGSAVEPGPGREPAPAGPKLGQPCGPGDTCGEGTCVSYFGIAGARGPEFKSCEIRCDPQGACADGRKCVTVADGPGSVCRDPEPIQ